MTAAPTTKRSPVPPALLGRPMMRAPGRVEPASPLTLARRVERIYFLLRYHRAGQLARRLRARVRSQVERFLPPFSQRRQYPCPPIVRPPRGLPPPVDGLYRDHVRLGDFERGAIQLLNRPVALGGPFDWNRVERECQRTAVPRLWRFHLHYHEYLADLVTRENSQEAAARVAALLAGWCRAFPVPRSSPDAWHPYCIARRLPAWARLFAHHPFPDTLKAGLGPSMARQADWLARHLETDLGGNHLWENGRALTIAGTIMEGPAANRWRSLGLGILDRCLEEQILPSGEHCERSPTYQLRLAAGLVELADWLDCRRELPSERYRAVARQMFRFLDRIRHPDGRLPLFGDSTLDMPDTRDPLGRTQVGWVGDYFVYRSADNLLLFDAGNLGPDHLPAHAHADLLGVEISLGGRRALVDSGTFAYEGPKRAEYRSARAHNVMMLDEVDHADLWSSFRMGRRGHVTSRASGQTPEGCWVRAAHDGYRHLGVDLVERVWFIAGEEGPWFSIHVARGRSRRVHRAREYLHWHPDAGVAWHKEAPDTARLPGGWVWEKTSAGGSVVPRGGNYSPDFYVEVPAFVFELGQEDRLPLVCAWSLSRGALPRATIRLDDDALHLTWMSGGRHRAATVPLTPLH